MKYPHKCPQCHRLATKRYQKLYLCDDCYRQVRRKAFRKKNRYIYEEVLVYTFPDGGGFCVMVPWKIH